MDMPPDIPEKTSDEVLLVRYANGDRDAARVLTDRLTPLVFAQAYRMLQQRADAEDVAQEAMLRLWRMAPNWRQKDARIRTWLWRVAANLAVDRLRDRGRFGELEEAPVQLQKDTKDAPALLQDRARRSALNDALAALPERQRQAVVLRHIEGMANPDIAAVLNLSVEAVESLIARGKRTLAGLLEMRKAELGYIDDQD